MKYVKMPGLPTTEVVNALSLNKNTSKKEQNPKDEAAAPWKEFFKSSKKKDKKDEKKYEPIEGRRDNAVCCPKKVKFIFVLNNAVVININAVADDNNTPV